jgi:3-ketoacyl-CoA synthase
VLSYIESFKGLNRGEKVWQLSFGSGFKCNSAIWVANRKIKCVHPCWADFDVNKMRAELAELGKLLDQERAARRAAAAEGKSVPRDE